MENSLHIVYDEYRFEGIAQFLDTLLIHKCTYYASDFLQADQAEVSVIENSVQRTMEIFKTLNLPIEEHFYRIYRGSPGYMYQDWKLSGLGCMYMLMNGDPTDLRNLAQQQTTLINQMLQHIHPYQIAHE